MIDMMQFKKCPKCGESNVDTATRCSICGAEMAPGGIERVSAMEQAAAPQPWEPKPAEPAGAPPPPPPGLSRPPVDGAALAKDEAEIAAARARASALNPLNLFKSQVLPFALALTVIAALLTLGKERPAAAPAAAQRDPRADAAEAFLDYTLQAGMEKGKTMRQFWADYQEAFAAARQGKDAAGMKLAYVAQQSALGGLMFDIFVVERVEGERGRVYPFRVDLETGEVAGATGCVFSPEHARDYAAEKCLPSKEVFPDGI